MINNNDVKGKAIEVIRNYMGDVMAGMYADFYANKKEEDIEASVGELLREYVGDVKATEILIKNGLIKTSI